MLTQKIKLDLIYQASNLDKNGLESLIKTHKDKIKPILAFLHAPELIQSISQKTHYFELLTALDLSLPPLERLADSINTSQSKEVIRLLHEEITSIPAEFMLNNEPVLNAVMSVTLDYKEDIIYVLVSRGANPNFCDPITQKLPISVALEIGSFELFEYLLDRTLKIDQSIAQKTLDASDTRFLEAVLSAGINVDMVDLITLACTLNSGTTVKHQLAILNVLLDHMHRNQKSVLPISLARAITALSLEQFQSLVFATIDFGETNLLKQLLAQAPSEYMVEIVASGRALIRCCENKLADTMKPAKAIHKPHMALFKRQYELAQTLFFYTNPSAIYLTPPIQVALKYYASGVIVFLVEHNVALSDLTLSQRYDLLLEVISFGNITSLKRVLDTPTEEDRWSLANEHDEDGSTPLTRCFEFGTIDKLHVLIDAGADVNLVRETSDGIEFAAFLQCIDVVMQKKVLI